MQAYLSVLCSKTANIHTFKDLKKKKKNAESETFEGEDSAPTEH